MRYLLTGSSGLLGSTFLTMSNHEVTCLSRAELDAGQGDRLPGIVAGHRPDAVINCAAHVQADQAEDDPAPAREANVQLPGRLAGICRDLQIPLVHFSSTGCYGNWKDGPYTEDDPLRPTTVHHTTKMEGERIVRETNADHLILRTGWLFGGRPEHKRNFVWQRLLEAADRATLTSDADQHGCPTLTDDVVAQTHHLLANGVRGTFNCVSAGAASRFDYVAKIVELFELPCRVVPGPAFARRAPVSPNETAVNHRLGSIGMDRMPDWVSALTRYRNEVCNWAEWKHLAGARGGSR
ncbi:SDR family oxidoreductase [Methylobacterium sp. J-076]|uniref:SDR family oxidoreductase n=1 Tax=Methylobacterium sp. J-076 TaxID=2836655 RepID=UPI001FB9588B|nr:NAD(P)-dependent oxidoreductase [Methylobacterium sp. J-076]MCJ2011960.1 NAD(P)-dependent oxidoreductase [Methylobacterium sp. J-076]